MRRSAPSIPPGLMSFIALFSVANTALVNYVTASRLIYGMADQGLLPRKFAAVHATRRTPHIAITALMVVLLLLVASGNIADLAAATVLLLLVVFIAMNAALIVLKRKPGEARGQFEVPLFLPAVGALVCAGLLVVRLWSSDWHAPALAAVILLTCLAIFATLQFAKPSSR
jgi:amino acid transporter